MAFLQPDGVKTIYLHGHRDPARISPDAWNVDLHLLDSGHFVLEDQTEVVADLITRFYQQRVAGIR